MTKPVSARPAIRPYLLAASAIAIALAVVPTSASAQGFQGNGNVVEGFATIVPSANSTDIVIDSDEVVIDWTPSDTTGTGTIDFLPDGSQAVFSAPQLADYTVLNRILPLTALGGPAARAIALNGSVTSEALGSTGGNVWFYSPTGIIVGPTATFSVGGLLLTTNDIVFGAANTGGTILFGAAGEVQFRGPADPDPTNPSTFVDIQSGAQIAAASYFAIVSPRIVQGGEATVGGPVAYVAAEQADLTINAGLFDITITQGTTDGNGVVHTGTTTGFASDAGGANPQAIHMVALPKNDALTMLLSGSIGYPAAASAATEGSSVVLSAGYSTDEPFGLAGNSLGNIQYGNVTVTNPLTAYASNTITVAPNGGTAQFDANAVFEAENVIMITAGGGESVLAAADLQLNAGQPGAGGTIDISVTGGDITVGGALNANASWTPLSFAGPTGTSDRSGGLILLEADGGTIQADTIFLDASADGVDTTGGATSGFINGVNAFGGQVSVDVRNGGEIVAPSIFATSSALGGDSNSSNAGSGTGGSISLFDNGGALMFDSVGLDAAGLGGSATNGFVAGTGTGGTVVIGITSQAQSWDSLSVSTLASGGAGADSDSFANSAFGQADAIDLTVTGSGSLIITNTIDLNADSEVWLDGIAGYQGQAGGITLTVENGGQLSAGAGLNLSANARFNSDEADPADASSPVQQGGTILVALNGGQLTTPAMTAQADAYAAGAPIDAGAATGGSVQVDVLGGGLLQVDDGAGTAGLLLTADAFGAPDALPGDATGGSAVLAIEDATATILGDTTVSASARGNADFYDLLTAGDGHDATGGTAVVELRPGTTGASVLATNALTVAADGDAQSAGITNTLINGDGGTGTGGTADLIAGGGNLTATTVTVQANGIGGTADPTAGNGGDGFGGTARMQVADGGFDFGATELRADSIGGDGAAGGDATGGTAGFLLADTTAATATPRTIASLLLSSTPQAGAGGMATAGETQLTAHAGSAASGVTVTGDFTATALGDIAPAGNGFTGDISGAAFTVGGNAAIDTVRDVDMAVADPGVFAVTGDLAMTTPRSITTSGPITVGGNSMIVGDLGVMLGGLSSGGNTLLQAVGGLVSATDLRSEGLVTAQGTSIDIASSATLAFAEATASAGDANILTAGDLSAELVSATGAVDLQSTGGGIATTGDVTGAVISMAAADDVEADAGLIAAGSLSVDAGGAFVLAGAALGTSIAVSSADIAIADGAAIGLRGLTQDIALLSRNSAETTTIGGAVQGAGYTLEAEEAARLFADTSIAIAGLGDVAIDDLALAFGAGNNIGTGGQLEISTPARIAIGGDVMLATSSADDTFLIDPTRIELDTDTGSIALLDDNGNPLGRLEMMGDTVAIATADVLAQLEGLDDITAINVLLDNPGGTASPLRAGSTTLAVTDGLFIQNTGASALFEDRRGFAAGALDIVTATPDTRIAINGQILAADGPVNGLDTQTRITINGVPAAPGGQFDPRSTINGCVIGLPCDGAPGSEPPTDSDLETPLNPDNPVVSLFVAPLIELTGSDPLIAPPLVDEPITGVGNDDLWQSPCTEDVEACPEAETSR